MLPSSLLSSNHSCYLAMLDAINRNILSCESTDQYKANLQNIHAPCKVNWSDFYTSFFAWLVLNVFHAWIAFILSQKTFSIAFGEKSFSYFLYVGGTLFWHLKMQWECSPASSSSFFWFFSNTQSTLLSLPMRGTCLFSVKSLTVFFVLHFLCHPGDVSSQIEWLGSSYHGLWREAEVATVFQWRSDGLPPSCL